VLQGRDFKGFEPYEQWLHHEVPAAYLKLKPDNLKNKSQYEILFVTTDTISWLVVVFIGMLP
jgi:hypothetical protein